MPTAIAADNEVDVIMRAGRRVLLVSSLVLLRLYFTDLSLFSVQVRTYILVHFLSLIQFFVIVSVCKAFKGLNVFEPTEKNSEFKVY